MTNPKKLMRGIFVALALVAAPLAGVSGTFIGVDAAQAQQQRLISAVLFEGNSGFSDAQLLAMVNVAEQGSFTEAGLAADAESIRQAYVGKGYMGVTVTPRVEQSENGRARITFVVNEGQRTGIAAINFTGNNSIGSGTLKSIIRTHETSLLSWLFRDDTYSEDLLTVDRGLIELYYMNHGYPDAQVTSAVGEYDASRNAYFVNFTISEGERYKFGQIGVETSIPGLNPDAMTGAIRTGKGGTYSLADLQKSQEDLAFEATAQGYAFADVRPRIDRDVANSTFNITYLVDEGARIYVERINITGNTKTRDAVIRRELDFGEGDPFNRSMVQRGKSRIEGLGFFKTVSFDMQAGSAPDKVIINITVDEQSTGDYGLTAGFDSNSGLLGEVSVTERNFLGRGQYVRAALSASESGNSIDFSFTEPRFMGLRVSAGFDVYHRVVGEKESNIYGTTATGGQLRFGAPITTDLNGSIFVGLEQKVLKDEEAPFSAVFDPTDPDYKDTYNKAWVGYSLVYNTLDDSKHPTEGIYATFTQQYMGWDYNLLKTEAKARYFMPLLSDWNVIGSVKGQAGYITALDGGSVSPLEAFRSSGSLVRGFQSGGMGPKYGASNELLGYTGYVAASAEIEFPIPVLPETYGVRGAVWADAALIDGNGSSFIPKADSIDENFKSSVGASIIWDSPFGPLRGDFAYVLNKATDDKTQVFSLTLQQLL
ncbi:MULTISPECIES: outer membrane protein assembly factor BamA [unclassified Devosia]|mgnify:CR=1 FL=1|uniref:outer membrane protein assembly factor BamA n=1 Tax=unclassified Devosia TaxID=196773 RepID=UPI00086F5AF7|nr:MULTISPECIES: outer membrane protein assembly factor BamA [unclassified Devosia]MBN9361606.1 outer membrane protein assembly factor BamA [Devosia sp.]ODS91762.1 MAG: outer membrane protein assembly factor BamA [Devosia sp. SCN 66-27]OJX26655.1 MAG: outer membrane protein assembly factor BamA [Devosia sp. 66-14]